MHQIFFLTDNLHHALGIEDLLPSFHIIHATASQLTVPLGHNGVDIKTFTVGEDYKDTPVLGLLENKEVQNYITQNTHGQPDVLVYKITPEIEKLTEKLGYNLLGVRNPILKTLSGLKHQLNLMNSFGLFQIDNFISYNGLEEIDLAEVEKTFEQKGTVLSFRNNIEEVEEILLEEGSIDALKTSFSKKMFKPNEYIIRPSKIRPRYIINGCITRLGTVLGGICEEIYAVNSLSSNQFSTTGHDFTQRHLDQHLRSELVSKTTELGNLLMKEGWMGLFSVLLEFDPAERTFYFIRLTAGQSSAVSYNNYLNRMHNRMPISLWQSLELLNHDYYQKFDILDEVEEEWINEKITEFRLSNDRFAYNLEACQPIKASQVIFKNKQPFTVKILDQFPSGVFRIRGRLPEESALMENEDENYAIVYKLREDGWSTLCLISRGATILETDEEGFIIDCPPQSTLVKPDAELGRIQLKESAFSDATSLQLTGWIDDVINAIYENTRIIKGES